MTDSELRKLKRRELLEILLEQAKQIEQLEQENAGLKRQLEDRRIYIQNAGTMAEAAFALNGVFEAADAAVSQYVENIRAMAEESKNIKGFQDEADNEGTGEDAGSDDVDNAGQSETTKQQESVESE